MQKSNQMNAVEIAPKGTQHGTAAGSASSAVTPPATRRLKAVCVDIINLGTVQTKWGPKTRLKFVFETEELKPNGYPRMANRTHNLSLYLKSRLRQDLDSWRGRPVTPAEMTNGVDFDKLVGKACELEVQDATTAEGHAYLQIETIRKAGKEPLAPSGSYRRWPGAETNGKTVIPFPAPDTGAASSVDPAASEPGDDDYLLGLEAQAEAMLDRKADDKVIVLTPTGDAAFGEMAAEAA